MLKILCSCRENKFLLNVDVDVDDFHGSRSEDLYVSLLVKLTLCIRNLTFPRDKHISFAFDQIVSEICFFLDDLHGSRPTEK